MTCLILCTFEPHTFSHVSLGMHNLAARLKLELSPVFLPLQAECRGLVNVHAKCK